MNKSADGHTVVSSSMCRVKLSSHGRFTHEMVSAFTQHSDNIGGSGCDGTVPLVQYTTVVLNRLQSYHRKSFTAAPVMPNVIYVM